VPCSIPKNIYIQIKINVLCTNPDRLPKSVSYLLVRFGGMLSTRVVQLDYVLSIGPGARFVCSVRPPYVNPQETTMGQLI